MALNCKPDQMAWIKKCPPRPHLVGHPVKCRSFYGHQAEMVDGVMLRDLWLIEYQGKELRADGCQHVMPDAWLTPWTNPGDGEVDEMVQRLGKPESREVAV